jgi:hypothetical protein
MIEEAIFTQLNGWAGLSALAEDRIYPMTAPQNAATPFITYQRISGPRLRSLLGASGQANPRIQIDVYGASYASAKAVAEQVRLALDNFRGTVAGVVIRACSLESDRDLIDPDVDPPLHRVSHDFTIWHDE